LNRAVPDRNRDGDTGGRVPSLLITGTIGTGKTAVAAEIGLLLDDLSLPTAVVDLDWLGWVHLGRAFHGLDQLIAVNLAAIWPNLRDAGARRLVLVRAVHDRESVAVLQRALPEADLTVVRLVASPDTIRGRLRARDAGAVLEEHLAETLTMDEAMDGAAVEDFQVENDGRALREVGIEVLRRACWLPS
jgi:hypothetical protein